jgi:hypothetical protein
MTRPAQAAREASRQYRLDLPTTRRRHSESTKFVIAALWTAGYSAGSIGRLLGMSTKRTLNAAQKLALIDRATATDEERQQMLNDLKAIRCEEGPPLDGGRLDQFDWKIIPLDGRKARTREGGRQ